MQNELLIGIGAGIGGMLGWGFADFFAKKTIDEIGDMVSLVWAHILGTAMFGLVALYQLFILKERVVIPTQISEWGLLAFFGFLQAIVYFFVYKGFGKGQLALLSPVFSTYSALAAIIAIFVFGEIVNAPKVLSLLVIFTGILLLSMDMEALKSRRISLKKIDGLNEVIFAALFAAIWTSGWGIFVAGKNWIFYALCMYAFMTLVVFLIAKLQKISLDVKPNMWKFLLLIGLGETVAYLSISYGFSATSHISVIALLSGAFSLPVVFLSRIFLKEKISHLQTAGSLTTILGVSLLSLLVSK